MIFNNFFLKYHFSDVELKHLLLGTLLFTAVMVSIFFDSTVQTPVDRILLVTLLVVLTAPLFFLHEIGHKINAQKFNLWAEFRIDPNGAMITALSIILPFKFVAPGAVMIRATDYSEVPAMGKVAGYGPAVNIFLGGLYLIISGAMVILDIFSGIDFSLLTSSFFFAAGFSFFLGIFNMLPFGPLDGKKVKFWNNNAFWMLFSVTAIFALETYISFFFFGYNQFLIGSILFNFVPELSIVYILILGILSFTIGYIFLKKLSDPNWEPGKQPMQNVDYRQYYYKAEPSVKTSHRSTHSSSAPMNTPCAECGKKDLLPFKCSSCNKIFCAEHRLPGKHFCVVDANSR